MEVPPVGGGVKTVQSMERFENVKGLSVVSPFLPNRLGKRPKTIPGPFHVQCDGHGDDKELRQLVEEVRTWPKVEVRGLSLATSTLICFKAGGDLATGDSVAFAGGKEFGRFLACPATIHLVLSLPSAHWAVFRGWGEPHFGSDSGLISSNLMVVYSPRDRDEAAVCRSLFWVSYNESLCRNGRNSAGVSAVPPPLDRDCLSSGEWIASGSSAVISN
jgi:hypothetical protein